MESLGGWTELAISYWWVGLLVLTLVAGGSVYYWYRQTHTAVEQFAASTLPNTPSDELPVRDKECAFMNLAIAQSKQILELYEKNEKGKQIIEGFTTEQKKDHNVEMQQHRQLIKTYTARQKEIGCEVYEGMVAEIMSRPAQKDPA